MLISWFFLWIYCDFLQFVFFHRYRPAYKAFRSDSSFNFMVFFIIFFFQFIWLLYQSIGMRGSGYCGFITAVHQFDGTVVGILIGLVTLSIACSFAVCAIANFLLLTKVSYSLLCNGEISISKSYLIVCKYGLAQKFSGLIS